MFGDKKNEESDENDITFFAETDFRKERKRFGIKRKDRRYHAYIIGKTGMGKSTLLQTMISSDVRKGEGLAVLDPHGDLIEKVLKNIPACRKKDLIYLNPQDKSNGICFNPLENKNPEESHLVASGLISVFKKIWQDFWGPRMEHILRNALLTLLEFPNTTLLDLQRLLVEKDFRKEKILGLKDRQVQYFWLNEFEKYSKFFRQEAIAPIQNKIGQFLSSPIIRKVIAQPKSSFNLREVMDQGKILLVNLSKGKIGEDNASLLGAMLTTKIGLTALSRGNMPEEQRQDFYLYIDEFQSFITDSYIDVLAEARKYRLNLILAHQYLNQIEEKIRQAVFGNVGTIVSFRIGAEDARYLEQEFYPVFGQEDLVNLPCYTAYLKLMIDGKTSAPFSGRTFK